MISELQFHKLPPIQPPQPQTQTNLNIQNTMQQHHHQHGQRHPQLQPLQHIPPHLYQQQQQHQQQTLHMPSSPSPPNFAYQPQQHGASSRPPVSAPIQSLTPSSKQQPQQPQQKQQQQQQQQQQQPQSQPPPPPPPQTRGYYYNKTPIYQPVSYIPVNGIPNSNSSQLPASIASNSNPQNSMPNGYYTVSNTTAVSASAQPLSIDDPKYQLKNQNFSSINEQYPTYIDATTAANNHLDDDTLIPNSANRYYINTPSVQMSDPQPQQYGNFPQYNPHHSAPPPLHPHQHQMIPQNVIPIQQQPQALQQTQQPLQQQQSPQNYYYQNFDAGHQDVQYQYQQPTQLQQQQQKQQQQPQSFQQYPYQQQYIAPVNTNVPIHQQIRSEVYYNQSYEPIYEMNKQPSDNVSQSSVSMIRSGTGSSSNGLPSSVKTVPMSIVHDEIKYVKRRNTHPVVDPKSSIKKNRICPICNKVFNRPSGLRTHMHIHTGEKPFKCDWPGCDKDFSVRSNMIRHGKIHKRKDEKYNVTLTDDSSKINNNSSSNCDDSNNIQSGHQQIA